MKELAKKIPCMEAKAKIEQRRAMGRIRQRRYRRRKKENYSSTCSSQRKKSKLVVTEYWRNKKRQERHNMHPQKKRRIREKDRKRKCIQRMNNKNKKLHCPLKKTGERRKVTSVVEIGNSAEQAHISKKILSALRKNCEDRNSKKVTTVSLINAAKKCYKKASDRYLSKTLGINRKTIQRAKRNGAKRKSRKDKFNKDKVKRVQEFYLRDDISRILPNKRYTTKNGPGRVMNLTIRAAYKMFRKEHVTVKIGLTKFYQLRPENVRMLSAVHRDICLCPYCLNIRYKLSCLNRVIIEKQLDNPDISLNRLKIDGELGLRDMVLCPKKEGSKWHDPKCIEGKCLKCKTVGKTIKSYYRPLESYHRDLTWNHWERKESEYDGKIRISLVTKRDKISVVIDELCEDVQKPISGVSFIQHLHTANWQYSQFQYLKKTLPKNWCVMIMDFGQNRNIFYQDEIKSAHFSKSQMTIHPIVSYYYENDLLVRNSLIFLSDDLTHDYHAVEHFQEIAISKIKSFTTADVTRFIVFSDGCPSQYKGKGTFADLSLSRHNIERCYYGSEHGKGEGDGEIGCLNRSVDLDILGRRVIINNAEDLYKWCSGPNGLVLNAETSKRSFLLVTKGEIVRDRPKTFVKTLKGTRKYHQIQKVAKYVSLHASVTNVKQ